MIGFEAGRELDALVAEKVLGWRVAQDYSSEYSLKPGDVLKRYYVGTKVGDSAGYAYIGDTVGGEKFHPSIDIAAALEALEKDDGAGWDFTLTRYAASSVPWQVEASRHVDGLVISEAGETCALAICRVLIKTRDK